MADRRSDGALDVLPDMPAPLAPPSPELSTAPNPVAEAGVESPPRDAPAAKTEPAGKAKAPQRKSREPRTLNPAPTLPVARIAVDVPLAHLDRPFDYLVPDRLAEQARPGTRVRVRFAGQLTDGFVLARVEASEHQGSLRYLERVVSSEQVLTPEIAGLARAVADRYAGTFADVLRLAIPPRHAATETAARVPPGQVSRQESQGHERPPGPGSPQDPGPWRRYPAGEAFLDALAAGRPARAAWTALPGDTWPEEIARAAAVTASAGRGTVIVVPDARDLARVDAALAAHAAPHGHVTLTAELGPAERYRRWLAALRGEVAIVAGTRAAMFAPVRDLGLVVLWDDGDDLHAEPRAPYPNAREVLALRAHRAGAAALIGGFSRTTELAQLVRAGWARDLVPDRQTLRATGPRVRPAVDDRELARNEAAATARLPSLALRTARAALASGPVLVQVPRRGYLAVVACARCRAQARCTQLAGRTGGQHAAGDQQALYGQQTPSDQQTPSYQQTPSDRQTLCNGPLRLAAPEAAPDCRWCGALAGGWRCPRCGHDKLRAIVTGAARTAEELGRAFPGVTVRTSGADSVLPAVPDQPALVIATPGAEPVAHYAAALLLDGWALLARPGLRAGEEALRRWLAAAALVRPGGTVLVHADQSLSATQALIRWDPGTFAERELAERAELGFPPAVRMASVSGEPAAVAGVLTTVEREFEVLGPVPLDGEQHLAGAGDDQVRALVRAPRDQGTALARALQAAQAARSARKEGGGVRVRLDPAELI
jgi:primosomal protein N' (replication factor Y)